MHEDKVVTLLYQSDYSNGLEIHGGWQRRKVEWDVSRPQIAKFQVGNHATLADR